MLHDWEIWLDCHISPIIAKWLQEDTGLVVRSAYTLNLYFLTDQDIFNKAKESGKIIIITKDIDFSQLLNEFGAPPKIIRVSIGNTSNRLLFDFLKPRIPLALEILTNEETNIVELEY